MFGDAALAEELKVLGREGGMVPSIRDRRRADQTTGRATGMRIAATNRDCLNRRCKMPIRNPGLIPFIGAGSPSVRRDLDRFLSEAFGGRESGWTPAVDVREDENEITIECELPGMRAENVTVDVDNSVLSITGEKREERTDEEEGRYHLVERSYGKFYRSFQLPAGVDEEQIQADFENGILRVHIPKAALPQPRRIQVGGGGVRQQVRAGAGGDGEERGGRTRSGQTSTGGKGKKDATMAARERREE